MKKEMNTLNDAALENVTGGTLKESEELAKEFGSTHALDFENMYQQMNSKANVSGQLTKDQSTPNQYYDRITRAPLTQQEVVERIRKHNAK